MAAKTDYLENKILDHVLGVAAYTAPTPYVALFTADPGESGDTTNEVSGGGYARVDASSAFGSAASGSSSNSSDIAFAQATADWGTVTHVAIMDAATGGNMLYYGALSASKTVAANDTFKFEAGELKLNED